MYAYDLRWWKMKSHFPTLSPVCLARLGVCRISHKLTKCQMWDAVGVNSSFHWCGHRYRIVRDASAKGNHNFTVVVRLVSALPGVSNFSNHFLSCWSLIFCSPPNSVFIPITYFSHKLRVPRDPSMHQNCNPLTIEINLFDILAMKSQYSAHLPNKEQGIFIA